MKKHLSILMLLAALLVPWASKAQEIVSIGDATSTVTNYSLPVNMYFNYSCVQQIFTAAEIETAGTITAISFEYTNSSSFSMAGMQVYMKHTSKTQFSSNTDMEPISASDLVWTGTFTASASGWVTINLDTPFIYDGSSNLLICFYDPTNGYPGSAFKFRNTNTTDYLAISYYSDSYTPTLSDLTSFDGNKARYQYRNNIQLTITAGDISCYAVKNLTVSDITSESMTLSWIDTNNTGATYNVYSITPTDTTLLQSGTSDTFYTATNLSSNTLYTFGVMVDCGSGDLSAMRIINVRTACAALTANDLPYTENFESYGSTSSDPISPCWHKGTSSSTPYPYPSSTVVSGTRSLYFYGYNSTSSTPQYCWAALPPIDDNLNMSDLMVSLKVKRGSTASTYYTTRLYIGIADSIVGFTSAAALDTLVTWVDTLDYYSAAASSIHSAEISFADYTGDGKYVVIYAPVPAIQGSNTYAYNYAYVDDVVLRNIPTCFWPTAVTVQNVGSDQVTITWTPDTRTPSPSGWIVEYGPHGFIRGNGTTLTETSTTATLTALLANTEYDVYISADCGNEISDPATLTFRTACGALTVLPYTEDFETSAVGTSSSTSFVTCWNRINNGSQYFGYPYVSNTASYNHTTGGTKSLYWYGTTTTGTYGDYMYAVMPAIDTDVYEMNTVMVRFWGKTTGTSYHPVVQVGVMTNPLDQTTFQPLRTFNVEGTAWVRYEVALNNFTGNGNYIAFKAVRPTSSWYMCIDDVTIMEIPSCYEFANLEANATVGAAVLTWEPSISDANAQGLVHYKADSATAWIEGGVASGNAFTITGLDASTDYNARVAALCGNGDTSEWVYVDFTTGDFGCLELDPATADTVLFSNSTSGQSGCLAYSSWGNTVYQTVYTAAELTAAGLTPGGITGIDLGFTASSSYAKEFTIFMGNTTTSSISSATIENPQQQVYGPAPHPMGTSGWQHYDFAEPFMWDGTSNILVTTFMNQPTGTSQSASTGLTGYYVSATNKARYRYKDSAPFTLSDLNSGSAGSGYNYRAAIHFYKGECMTYATCAAPSASISYIGVDSVTVNWAPGATETSWDLFMSEGTNGTFSYVTTVTENEYTFTNLTPGTEYEFKIATICYPDTFATTVSAFTNCVSVRHLMQDFESYATGTSAEFDACWTKDKYGTTTNYPYVNTIDGSKAMYFYGYLSGSTRYYSWMITPEFVDSLNLMNVEFDMRRTSTTAYYTSKLIIGAVSNPNNISNMDSITEVEITNPTDAGVWKHFNVSLADYHGNGKYIVFYAPAVEPFASGYTYTYNYLYLDNIIIESANACPRPTRFHSRNITSTAAELAWDAYDTVDAVTVKWGTGSSMAAATDSIVVTGGNFVNLTGLTPGTNYYCWATNYCGEGESFTMTTSFTTAASCGAVLNFTAGSVGLDAITFSWEANEVSPATSYLFSWKADSATVWTSAVTANTFYVLTGLDEGTTYNAKVMAQCGDDSSAASTLTVTTNVFGTIGSNDGTYYIPTYPYYNHSISEQLWLNNELTAYGDTINGIYFNAGSAIAGRPMKIWVGNTTLTDLSTASFVPSTSLTQVFDTIHNVTAGWNYFPFSTPFIRTAGSNFVVMVTDDEDYETFSGWVASSSAVNSLYDYNDDAAYSTTDLSGLTAEPVRAQMRLDATLSRPTCVAPHPVIADVTASSITVAWAPGANETSWAVSYRGVTDTTWITVPATTDTFFTATGLAAASRYIFSIGSICGTDTMTTNITGITGCGSFTVPYVEDFNTMSTNDYTLNPCWTKGTTGTGDTPYTVNITNEGMMSVLPRGAYLIFPTMDVPVNQLQLRVRFVTANTSIYSLVGICSYPGDIQTFTTIDTLWCETAGTATWITVPFDSYIGDGQIAIWSNYNQSYVDDVNIELIPMCRPADSLTATAVTTTSVTLSWNPGTNGSSYIVDYWNVLDNTNVTSINTNTTSATINGLHHSTSYGFSVRTVCVTMNDTSLATNTLTVTTECAAVDSLPYVQDFDHCNAPALTETGILPNCWNYASVATNATYTTGSYLPQIYNGNASSSPYCLRMYGLAVVALPEMPTSVDSLMLSFHDYISSPTYYGLIIGVVDSVTPGFEASFVPVDTLISSTTQNNYTTYALASYTGTGRYIAFKNYYINSTSQYSYHYIDDVVVDYLPSCLPVVDVTAILDSATSITLDWTDLRPSTEWEIAYGTTPLTDPSTGTVLTVTAHPYEVTNLSDTTDYYFYIRNICGAGDSSTWTRVGPVHCHSVNMRANQTDTVYMCGGTIYDDGGPNGNYSNSQDSYIIVMPADGSSLVNLTGSVSSESCCDHLYIYEGIGTSGTQLFSGESGNINVTSTVGPITVYFHTDGSVNSYYGFALNVNCIPDNCPASNLRRDPNVPESNSSLALIWDGTAASYDIEYGPSGFAHGTGSSASTTNNSYNFTGLTSMATYDFYVRGICSTGDTGFWHVFSYTVPMCDNVVEFVMGDSTAATTTQYYVPVNNYYRYTLTEIIVDSAEIAGINDFNAIAFYYDYSSPTTDKNDVDIYLMHTTRTVFASTSDLQLIDTSATATNRAVHVYHGPLNCTQGWNTFGFSNQFVWDGHSNIIVIVDDNSYDYNSSSHVFLARNCTGNKTINCYSDSDNPSPFTGTTLTKYLRTYRPEMKFVSCGGCSAPVIASISHDYESAIITVSGSGDNFELQYGTDPSIMTDSLSTTTNTFTLTGLLPATTYYFQVRQDCGEGEMSPWGEGYFITDTLPCLEVTGLDVTGTSYTSISVSWTAGGNETAWEAKAASTVDSVTVTVTTTSATIEGLVPQRLYSVTVRPMCGSNHNIEGPWCDPETTNTDACLPVSNVTVSDISATSATVAWTAPDEAVNFRVLYGLHDFDVNGEIGSYTTTSNPFALTGLEANTPYTVRVAVECTENLVSSYESADFTTANVGIFSADNDGALSLYPNPASTMVTLRVSEQLVGSTVSIVDVNGRVVMSEELNSQTLTLDLSEMAKGAYFVRITGDQATAVRKLIVK